MRDRLLEVPDGLLPLSGGCPVCGSVEVTGHEWEEFDETAWQSMTCDDCGSLWEDVYLAAGRENVRRGSRVDVATARQSVPVVGPADYLDMAYEDRTDLGDEGRIYSGGWES